MKKRLTICGKFWMTVAATAVAAFFIGAFINHIPVFLIALVAVTIGLAWGHVITVISYADDIAELRAELGELEKTLEAPRDY